MNHVICAYSLMIFTIVSVSSSTNSSVQISRLQNGRIPFSKIPKAEISASGSELDDDFRLPAELGLRPSQNKQLVTSNVSPFGYNNNLFTNNLRPEYSQFVRPNCLGHPAGMYGSPTYQCRVYYVCQTDGRLDPMPCSVGTRFNNYLGVCDWEEKVDNNCNPIYNEINDRYSSVNSLVNNPLLSSEPRIYNQQYRAAQPLYSSVGYNSGYNSYNSPQGLYPFQGSYLSQGLYSSPRYSSGYRQY